SAWSSARQSERNSANRRNSGPWSFVPGSESVLGPWFLVHQLWERTTGAGQGRAQTPRTKNTHGGDADMTRRSYAVGTSRRTRQKERNQRKERHTGGSRMPSSTETPLLEMQTRLWKARAQAKQKWLERTLGGAIKGAQEQRGRGAGE